MKTKTLVTNQTGTSTGRITPRDKSKLTSTRVMKNAFGQISLGE